jgi:hypothetical protein
LYRIENERPPTLLVDQPIYQRVALRQVGLRLDLPYLFDLICKKASKHKQPTSSFTVWIESFRLGHNSRGNKIQNLIASATVAKKMPNGSGELVVPCGSNQEAA